MESPWRIIHLSETMLSVATTGKKDLDQYETQSYRQGCYPDRTQGGAVQEAVYPQGEAQKYVLPLNTFGGIITEA